MHWVHEWYMASTGSLQCGAVVPAPVQVLCNMYLHMVEMHMRVHTHYIVMHCIGLLEIGVHYPAAPYSSLPCHTV